MVHDYSLKFNLYLWLCLFLRNIPLIRQLKIVTLPLNEILYNHFENFVSSYEIIYPKEAYLEIVKIVEPSLAICDDKLLRLYIELKKDREETFLYAGTAALLLHLMDKQPEIFKTEETQKVALLNQEFNKLNIKELEKLPNFKERQEGYIQKCKSFEEKIMFKIWLHCQYMFARLRGELEYAKDPFEVLITKNKK